jgi:hypothetical protein
LSKDKTGPERINGKFAPGHSGNPGGAVPGYKEIRALALEVSPEAIGRMVQIMRTSKNERTALEAAKALLDRGVGKPKQIMVGDDEDGPLQVVIKEYTWTDADK